jgi:hypothetical protein
LVSLTGYPTVRIFPVKQTHGIAQVRPGDNFSFPHLSEEGLKKPFEEDDGAQDLDDHNLGI